MFLKPYRRSFHGRAVLFLPLFAVSLIMISCSSSSTSSGASPAPTATLTASPSPVYLGAQTNITLTFSSTNADSGTISGQGTVGTNGSVTIPEPTVLGVTTYTFTATGTGGSATATASVTVNPAPPLSVTLTANPTAALAGTSLTLTWASQNAASVTISGIPGQNHPVGANPPSGGNISFMPTGTATYTATAYGADGQPPVTFDVKVPVNTVTSFAGMGPGPNSPAQDIDPNGAMGTYQYLQYVNTYYQAYDRNTLLPVLPSPNSPAPQPVGNIWTGGANAQCEGTSIQLDAVVTFDRLALPTGRFVIAAKSTRGTASSADNWLCIAVSSGDDLTSSTWYSYAFHLTPVLGNDSLGNPYYPDWPKLATWPDGADSQEGAYYFSMDLEDQGTQEELGVAVCALDRTNMLLNGSMRTPQCFVLPSGGSVYLAHSLIPADVDGSTSPPLGRDEILVSIQNPPLDGSSTTSSTLNLWDCKLDPTWSTTSLPCTSAPANVPTYIPGCYLALSPSLTYCIPEPPYQGTQGEEVDSVGDRLMPRFAYRNLLSQSGYESFLISHTVQTGKGQGTGAGGQQTGIRWYEFRDATGTGYPTLNQSGTVNPDASLFRFLPSIAQDKNGNAAVGYSFSNGANMPGINVAYWNLNSPGALPAETTVLEGTGEEITPGSGGVGVGVGKWGSYSTISVDPTDDCTFWYVNEYWPQIAAAPWATNIANFSIPGCVTP